MATNVDSEIEKGSSALTKFDGDVLKGIARTDMAQVAPRALFIPNSMSEAMELAKLMASGIGVPPDFRGKPANVIIIVMQAIRWGLDPFAVASKAYFVNDRVAYESQLVAAVVNSSPLLDGRLTYRWDGDGDNMTCTVAGKLRGEADLRERTVRLARAKKSNGSPLWEKDPQQQLAYYTQRAWARLYMPEILLGVYTPDELATTIAPDTRGGAAVDTTPRRGAIAVDNRSAVERARGATIESTPGVDAAPAAGDLLAGVEAGEYADWNDERWSAWLNDLSAQFDTAPKVEVLELLDSQTADQREAAPQWVRDRYDREREAARADIEQQP